MTPPGPGKESNSEALARGIRIDLVIAVCALLISCAATAASLWQTHVIQQQLSAQVWPYVSVSENLDANRVEISIGNDGLGPAILRSASVSFKGQRQTDFIALLRAVLGRRMNGRHQHTNVTLSYPSAGSVLRAGETDTVFAFTSTQLAVPFISASPQVVFHICYCAIVPGTCWSLSTNSNQDPKPQSACAEDPHDLLHASIQDALPGISGTL